MAAPDAPRPSLLRGNAALIACCVLGLYDAAYIAKWAAGAPFPPFGDFFGFWTFGRFAQAHGGLIYDAGALIPFQQKVLPGLRGGYPFPYPPPFLLLLAPLALLPLGAAYIVWIGGTLAAYLAGVLGWRGGLLPLVALVVVPTTLLDVISGQNGLLTAALLAGGMRCLIATPGTRPGRPAAPVLAGVLLGMATYKPQFALLLPAVLLATRAWLTIGVACLTALLLAFISSLAFGWSVWPDWVRGMAGYQALLAMNTPNLLHLMPGVLAGARLLGLPGWLGVALQAIVSVWVVVTVWRLCARRLGLPEIAAALLGTMLLTPYALIYDAPIMTAGVALYWRALGDAGPDLADLAVSVLLVAALVTMVGSSLPMVAALLLAAQLYLAARFARRVT
jgi:hypothetical protein